MSGINKTQSYSRRERFAQHTGIGYIHRHFIRTDGHTNFIALVEVRRNFTQREVTEGSAQRLIITQTIETAHVCQVNIIDQLT